MPGHQGYTLNKLGEISSHTEAIRSLVKEHHERMKEMGIIESVDESLYMINSHVKSLHDALMTHNWNKEKEDKDEKTKECN